MDTNCNYKGIDFVDFSLLLDEDAKRLFDIIFPSFEYGDSQFPWRENSRHIVENSSPEKFSAANENVTNNNNNNGPSDSQPLTSVRQRTFSDNLPVSTPPTFTSGATLDMPPKAQVPPAPFLAAATGSPRTIPHNIAQFTQQAPPITFYSHRPPFPVVTSAYPIHGQELLALHHPSQPHGYSETPVYELQPPESDPQATIDHPHHPKYRSDKQNVYSMRKPKKSYLDHHIYQHEEVMQTIMDNSVDPINNQGGLPAPVVSYSNPFPPGMSAPAGYPVQYIHSYVPTYVPYTGSYLPQAAPLASPDVVPFEPPMVIPAPPPHPAPPVPNPVPQVTSQITMPCVAAPELPLTQPMEETCITDDALQNDAPVDTCENQLWLSNEVPSSDVAEDCDLKEPLEERVAEIEISDKTEVALETVETEAAEDEDSPAKETDSLSITETLSEPEPPTAKAEEAVMTSNSPVVTVSTAPVVIASAWGSGKSWAGLFKSEGVPVPDPTPNKVQESPDSNSEDEESFSDDLETDVLLHKLGKFIQRLKLDFTTRPFQPRGLINRSNWCYINATLQALLVCPALYNMLRQLQDVVCQRNKSSTPIMDSLVELVSEFTPVTNVSKRKEDLTIGPPLEPTCIHKMLTLIKSECIKGRQEDAEEFLSCILNGLHEEMVSLTKATTALNNGTCNGDVQTNGRVDGSEEDDEDDSWKVMGAKNKGMVTRSDQVSDSLVKELFGGQTRSVLTAGSDCSAVLQPFFTLQLDIQTNGESVAESLSQLTVKEPIHGYQCPRSKKEVEACRRTTLEELPPVLILHFKRFIYDDKDGGSKKLLKRTDYPLDLELKTELLSPEVKKKYLSKQSRTYRLFAVVYHDGKEAVKGHYIADIFYAGSGSWLRCDDRNIMPTTEAQVLAFNSPCVPYLLFYSRTDLQQQQQEQASK